MHMLNFFSAIVWVNLCQELENFDGAEYYCVFAVAGDFYWIHIGEKKLEFSIMLLVSSPTIS